MVYLYFIWVNVSILVLIAPSEDTKYWCFRKWQECWTSFRTILATEVHHLLFFLRATCTLRQPAIIIACDKLLMIQRKKRVVSSRNLRRESSSDFSGYLPSLRVRSVNILPLKTENAYLIEVVWTCCKLDRLLLWKTWWLCERGREIPGYSELQRNRGNVYISSEYTCRWTVIYSLFLIKQSIPALPWQPPFPAFSDQGPVRDIGKYFGLSCVYAMLTLCSNYRL